jgi:hypothetical protein
MPGQPQIPGVLVFDCDDLKITTNPGTWDPSVIVGINEQFHLGATFKGSGGIWTGLKNQATQYKVSYFAEGIGKAATEADLMPTRVGNLTNADVYGPSDTQVTIPGNTLVPGVYRIACVVTFTGWPGVTGYYEDLVIQVY